MDVVVVVFFSLWSESRGSTSISINNDIDHVYSDVIGDDAESLLEYCSVAKVGGDTPFGKGVYTHFLDHMGGIHSDLTIVRLARAAFRVICGGDTGHRDYIWMRKMQDELQLPDIEFSAPLYFFHKPWDW